MTSESRKHSEQQVRWYGASPSRRMHSSSVHIVQPASTSGQSLPDRAVFKRKRQQQASCIDPEGQHEASKGAADKAGSACSAAPQVEAEQQERQEQHQEVAAEAPAAARRASPGRGKSRESASQPRSKSKKASQPTTEASLLISDAPKREPRGTCARFHLASSGSCTPFLAASMTFRQVAR